MASRKKTIASRVGIVVGAVSVILLIAYLLGGVFTFNRLMERTVGNWEHLVEVEVLLNDNITAEQSRILEHRLEAMPEVRNFSYVSKEAAFEEFRRLNPDPGVEVDALPASYLVRVRNPNAAESVALRLERFGGVYEVWVSGDDVASLLNVVKYIRTAILLFVAGLGVLGIGFIFRRTQLTYA